MTGSEIASIITASGAFVTSLGGMILTLRNLSKTEQVHKATNSMKDELVALTRKDGIAEGRALQKSEPNG